MTGGIGPLSIERLGDAEKTRADKLCQLALRWFDKNGRSFPWRYTRDPYRILVAEICLQKTNADKVAPVFEKIIEKYPDVAALARANESDLKEHFSFLGLFKRGNFLLQIANTIVNDYGGVVPHDKESLLKVKGIGEYTANSVLCLAHEERLPMLDGSTQRVLARLFNKQIDRPAWTNKEMRDFMEAILPLEKVREFNLALIDIAAKHCRPKKPKCGDCPLIGVCLIATVLESL